MAAQYKTRGFENAKVLGGGVEAWKKEGFPL
jgi:rhodanese-related sulfurtransferase